MVSQKPCKKVRADGIAGLLGCTSPTRVTVECPMCDHECRWYRKAQEECGVILINRHFIEGMIAGFEGEEKLNV